MQRVNIEFAASNWKRIREAKKVSEGVDLEKLALDLAVEKKSAKMFAFNRNMHDFSSDSSDSETWKSEKLIILLKSRDSNVRSGRVSGI